MSEFDYEKAWACVARPAFEALSQKVRDLLDYITQHSGNCSQDNNCDLRWPADPAKAQHIKDAMLELAQTDELSHSAHVINCYGSWYPAGKFSKGHQMTLKQTDPRAKLFQGEPRRIDGGMHWHYASYADQVLRNKHAIPRDSQIRSYGLAVHEGLLRVVFSSKDTWFWEEIAPVTDGIVAALKAAVTLFNQKCDILPSQEPYEMKIAALHTSFTPGGDKWGPWFNLKAYEEE